MAKVLVVYGSRWGSTEEISKELAKLMNENGIETELLNVEEIKSRDYPPFEEFDGILIGSGIRISKWVKSVRKFLKKYSEDINANMDTIGAFVSCGEGGDQEMRAQAKEKYVKEVLESYGVKVDIYEALGGRIDLTEESNLGKMARKMMNMAAKDDPNLHANEKNDTRDWERIRDFGINFCALVKK